ncbi:MAG: hypothetical protein M3252_03860 [Actinomycetota bacterium]|nr:hypothetical protein [Actinomycetota bacterium]
MTMLPVVANEVARLRAEELRREGERALRAVCAGPRSSEARPWLVLPWRRAALVLGLWLLRRAGSPVLIANSATVLRGYSRPTRVWQDHRYERGVGHGRGKPRR